MNSLLIGLALTGLTSHGSALEHPTDPAPGRMIGGPLIAPASDPMPPARERATTLRDPLETVLTVQLLAGLTEQEKIHWTAQQRCVLRPLLRPLLESKAVSGAEWNHIQTELLSLLSTDQRGQLEQARAEADTRAEHILSVSRLASVDGPPIIWQWRYAFALDRGVALLGELKKEPETNPYLLSPYREQVNILLGEQSTEQ
ncbi:hypothetical protein [Deinococcus radiophilus]|uniref:Uncharacterized protein n=1 Tax=Deinococcus radiophilus TaxID=32062 RepID=A0A3S0KLL1_9DEIO|nr:hypothetical protein [Deinococcus radiophilus]RTR29394.1 hypothetical protein EJ104_03110 [Deinococcus radiophilus]UFA50779.1 hypothetical protein LMT64_02400 [Deinococcus radiophilus]